METTRQQKISRLIQKELSDIFQKDAKSMHGVIVSITKTYISVFPLERAEEILDAINKQNARIRYELGTRVRFQLRIIPELKFFIDDSMDYLEHIDELLKK